MPFVSIECGKICLGTSETVLEGARERERREQWEREKGGGGEKRESQPHAGFVQKYAACSA